MSNFVLAGDGKEWTFVDTDEVQLIRIFVSDADDVDKMRLVTAKLKTGDFCQFRTSMAQLKAHFGLSLSMEDNEMLDAYKKITDVILGTYAEELVALRQRFLKAFSDMATIRATIDEMQECQEEDRTIRIIADAYITEHSEAAQVASDISTYNAVAKNRSKAGE